MGRAMSRCRSRTRTASEWTREKIEEYMSLRACPVCGGARLRAESRAVLVGGTRIEDFCALSARRALEWLETVELSATDRHVARLILREISERLRFLENVGIGYLSMDRAASTLSGGEAQRIRLATQIGSSLVGVLYILDEPSVGLHQRDNALLIETLKHLRDIGNTLIVVEHDEQTLRTADYIVDLGPGAGVHGGHVVAAGSLEEICANPRSLTGQYLTGALSIVRGMPRRKGSGKSLVLRGAREHNLKNITVEFPLGTFIAITGVSGSGKSSLLSDLLYPALSNSLGALHMQEGHYESLSGAEEVDKVISIDQSPIGR